MRLLSLVVLLVSCAGCAVTPPPVIEVTPEGPLIATPVVQEPVCPLERVEVTLLPRSDHGPTLRQPSGPAKQGVTGLKAVTQAQDAARLEPTLDGYQGGVHVYRYTPGQVYTVYLTKKQGTGIFLPPGDRLVTGLFLNEEEFDIEKKEVGTEQAAYDAIVLRPLGEKGAVDTFLLTATGRRYFLHLVVGQTGMLAVTFTTP